MSDEVKARVLALYGLSSLEEATRGNWPWWADIYEFKGVPYGPTPQFPNFEDPHHACILAAKARAYVLWESEGVHVESIRLRNGDEVWWAEDAPRGDTLGSALLAAVERVA